MRRKNTQKVQIHWQNSPSSPGNPSEQYQQAYDIRNLLQKHVHSDNVSIRMVDPNNEHDGFLTTDCVVTVVVLAVKDTKLENENANIVNQILKNRGSVFLVLKGLTDGNIKRFGFAADHEIDVVVYDLESFPKTLDFNESIFDQLIHKIDGCLSAVFNDYPVGNFSMLLQQSRYAEVKQEERSWNLLLAALVMAVALALSFSIWVHYTSLQKEEEIRELENATFSAKQNSIILSDELANLEIRYEELSQLQEQRSFYSNSLVDDLVTIYLDTASLELSLWNFEAEQYFMHSRVSELNSTLINLCAQVANAITTTGSTNDSQMWASFVSYCESSVVLQTCNITIKGDGICNGKNNYRSCAWDGGDCCPGDFCLDGTHVCDTNHWYDLDALGSCFTSSNCSDLFDYHSYNVFSDGIDRYTPSCTNGIHATELVFYARVPPGGIIEMRVDVADEEVPIFIEVYLVDNDVLSNCPVEENGLSPGTGPYFKRCSAEEDRYILVEGNASSATVQYAFFIVDIEDVAPMELNILWRNTSLGDVADSIASKWSSAQICEIGHNEGVVGDGTCHAKYNTASCGWDGGDCRCVFGNPTTESLGDGTCDQRFLNQYTNTRSCGWDGGDCAVSSDVDEISNLDKSRFDNDEIRDNYTVLPSSRRPEFLNISRHNRVGSSDEKITLVALSRCQEPDEWICPHEWYNGKSYVTFSDFYQRELNQEVHTKCPASADSLAESQSHFQNGQAICDCGCGAVDPDCRDGDDELDCGNYANIDPLTQRFDPLAPEELVPNTCPCGVF